MIIIILCTKKREFVVPGAHMIARESGEDGSKACSLLVVTCSYCSSARWWWCCAG